MRPSASLVEKLKLAPNIWASGRGTCGRDGKVVGQFSPGSYFPGLVGRGTPIGNFSSAYLIAPFESVS